MPPRFQPDQVERRTQQLGREMFAQTRAAAPSPLAYEWWEEQLLQQMMQYEWLKIQSFRFIDALPTIRDDVDVARHMREYFRYRAAAANGSTDNHAGTGNGAALAELEPRRSDAWLYRLISQVLNFRRLDSAYAQSFVRFSRWAAQTMAGGFIAGSNVNEALAAIRKMRNQSLAFTIDVLGESAVSGIEAEQYRQTYLDLIAQLPQTVNQWPEVPLIDRADDEPIPRVNVSVKVTSLYPGFDPVAGQAALDRARDILRPVFRAARDVGAHLQVDMEHYEIKDLTIELFEQLLLEDEFRDYPHFGLVLQAYLKDGDRDIQRLVDFARRRGTHVTIRLVKGAYWDSETVWADQKGWPWPVWEQKWMSDACFEQMSRVMLENHEHIHSAFASHNIRSLCHALALKEALNVPERAFEWQMLYGMGNPMKRAAVKLGQRCRVYTPFGELMPGMAYFIRRLLENTANESFLRSANDEAADVELLEAPEVTGAATPPFEREPEIRYEFEEPLMDPFRNVPNTDFALEENRRRMLAALGDVRAELGATYPLQIGGAAVSTDRTFDSLNPSRPSMVIGQVTQATEREVGQAVTAARDAYRQWRLETPAARADVLFRAAETLQARRFELAAWETLECGKPWREADADVSEAIDFCNYYGKEMLRISEYRRRRDIPGETNEYYYVPRGVTAVLSPWNFPLAITTGMIAAALVTGNTVVLKPASPAAVVAAKLVEVFAAAGLPPGVLNYLPGPGEKVGAALAGHPDVATVAFTGSRATGLALYAQAAAGPTNEPGLKRVIAELGGKNAIIVDSDADLDQAIKGTLASAFGYAGQKCSAASRLIVAESLYDRLLERLIEAARSKGVGPADEPATAVPPLIDRQAFEKVREYIEIGKQEATCVLETDVSKQIAESDGGYYVAPTIFTDVTPQMRIAREEVFGPVLCVLKATDIDDAIRLFNDSDYALTGGIYSRSPANIDRARAACDCGNFYINRVITGAKVDLQPFGGFKLSGTGTKAGGPDYLLQFCNARTVTENTLRRGVAPAEEAGEPANAL